MHDLRETFTDIEGITEEKLAEITQKGQTPDTVLAALLSILMDMTVL
jgi:hypothetical protein